MSQIVVNFVSIFSARARSSTANMHVQDQNVICWNVKDNLLFATPYAYQRRTNIKRGQNLRGRFKKNEVKLTQKDTHRGFFHCC